MVLGEALIPTSLTAPCLRAESEAGLRPRIHERRVCKASHHPTVIH